MDIKEFNKYLDCNKCKHLNMSETEQQETKDMHSFHKCNVYNEKVIHYVHKCHEFPRVYPCYLCGEDFHKRFQDR